MRRREDGRGVTLVEVLAVLALLAVLLAGAVASGADAWGDREADRALRAVAGEVRELHARAVARATAFGLKLERSGTGSGWNVTILEDGDGDGIRADDVARRIDRIVDGPQDFAVRYGAGAPGFHASLESLISPPPVSNALGVLVDPVRFGSSDVISCSPRGTITSGTLYLTDGQWRQFALVVYGTTGRLRAWEFDMSLETWRMR